MTDIIEDLREFPRVPINQIATLKIANDGEAKQYEDAVMRDMSSKGVFLETVVEYHEDDIVSFTLMLQNGYFDVIAEGIVRWCKRGDPKGIGVEFLSFKLEEREKEYNVAI